MINVTTQWSNHHILERIHIPGRPCFGDDDDHNDIQNTHGQPPSMHCSHIEGGPTFFLMGT